MQDYGIVHDQKLNTFVVGSFLYKHRTSDFEARYNQASQCNIISVGFQQAEDCSSANRVLLSLSHTHTHILDHTAKGI